MQDLAPVLLDTAQFEKQTQHIGFAARKLLEYAIKIRRGRLDVHLPDGQVFRVIGEEPSEMQATFIVRDFAFVRRLVMQGDIGFAEGYLRNEWDTPDLAAFLMLGVRNREAFTNLLADRPFSRLWQLFRNWLNKNTKSGSRRNIYAHYDIGNAFYEKWLDNTMTYSSALFEDAETLEAAQARKYEALADSLALNTGHHVLEIGCGWGGFAEFAAKNRDCRVTALTISQEQYAYAQQRMFREGLNEKVAVVLKDYRDVDGRFDSIASIEMFEAVGEQYWGVYFKTLLNRLKNGGRAGLQVITIDESIFADYKREIDFIRHYIFPGGMLPTPTIMKNLGIEYGLQLVADKMFGADYARTLALWRERFLDAWPAIATLGFDERFRRLWLYYLAYCEVGFAAGTIDVRQMTFAKA